MISRFLTTRLQNLRSFRFQINIIILIILFTFSFSTPIAEASIFQYFIPKPADYCPNCAAGHELEFGSPGISLNPASISYNMDSPDYRWEKIEICIFNPPGYHVKKAIITLDIPDTIEYKVSTDATTKFHYNPLTTTFTIENFGNYQRITQCDWFEIRPRIDTHSKNEVINLSYDIEYSEKVFIFLPLVLQQQVTNRSMVVKLPSIRQTTLNAMWISATILPELLPQILHFQIPD